MTMIYPILGIEVGDRDQLIIPYTLEANDMRFAHRHRDTSLVNSSGQYLKDSFDVLYAEGEQAGAAKMLSIGLHCRLIGRPGKLAGSASDFIDYIQGFEDVSGVHAGSTLQNIGAAYHPPAGHERPSQMDATRFRREIRRYFRTLSLDRRARLRSGARFGP